MIHFIYGDDVFRTREALNIIEDNFKKKYGDLSIDKLDGGSLSKGLLTSRIVAAPFLSEKKLVLVKNLLKEGLKEYKDEALVAIKSVPITTDLVFFEDGIPDKRESLFKSLDKLPGRQIFSPLEGYKLKKWAEEQVKKEGFKISGNALAKLILYVGQDLFRLKNEITNLVCLAKANHKDEIGLEEVEKLVEPDNTYKIFDLTDAIANRNTKKAMLVLTAFRKSGEDEFRLFNMIVHQVRTLIVIKDLLKDMTAEQAVKESGLHPYVVKKTALCLKNFTAKKLFAMYAKLEETDRKVKSGQMNIEIAIELLIVDFCERC